MQVINMERTGKRIHKLLRMKNIAIYEIQEACGFNTPQAIYKWLQGKSLPTLDNLVILVDVLDVRIDEILVIERRQGNE